ERKPKGFGFSDTAFRIFILMASRRLNSDRYFTKDFTSEMYTQIGMDWVQGTTMIDVLTRHYPELRSAMRGVDNAFQPWPRDAGRCPPRTSGRSASPRPTLLADSRSGSWGGFLPWALLVVGSVASLAANVAVAEPTTMGRVIAAWPSFALIGS